MQRYWKSLNEYNDKPENNTIDVHNDEQGISLVKMLEEKTNSNRRNFLKAFGFGLFSTVVATNCERPVTKAIPYLIKPEEITPGKASYYASSFYDGDKYCSILVKVMDGRPIKIEGNDLSGLTKGGTSAAVQASLLNLYDSERYRNPLIDGKKASWEEADKQIIKKLDQIKKEKGQIVLFTSSIISPATKSVILEFLKAYPTAKQVVYDPVSVSGILESNKQCFGQEALPDYRFDKAKVIVSFAADFLGTWISPIEYTKKYVKNRKLDNGEKKMSYHVHLESGMSLTGSNADKRIKLKPSEEAIVIANLYNYIAGKTNGKLLSAPKTDIDVSKIGDVLLKNKGRSLVVAGTNNTDVQCIINSINTLLSNYGSTIDLTKPLYTKQGNDQEVSTFIDELKNGKISAVLFHGTNPVYDLPDPEVVKAGLKNVDLSVSFAIAPDETSSLVKYNCPDHHFLEAWNDANPKKGYYSLAQPCIHPIFKTRQAQESLLKWAGKSQDYYSYLRNYWRKNISNSGSFDSFWNKALHDGVHEVKLQGKSQPRFRFDITSIKNNIFKKLNGLELQTYESVSIGTGVHANNPWLQELPDPVTKVCWDNYAAISIKLAKMQSLKTGDVIKINNSTEIPVLVQPGQEDNTISIALGYGRIISGKSGKDTGSNAYTFTTYNKNRTYGLGNIQFEKTGRFYELATTQSHDSMEGRAIVRETSLEKYLKNPASGNEMHEKIEKHHVTLYKKHQYNGHHWAMAVDLNSCTGCNACVVGCSVENNVPVVGKEEVKRAHEMHWIRIDRYYSGDSDNPEVVRQPVMCQHCDNAPCENVCPVAATTHSAEGINQMSYNRCIGTRYCNNNCPYKVRRFNWFDYNKADALGGNTIDPLELTLDLPRMVLNPDVTVRSKGVIEKCSFCVQRIQEKKLNAKLENRPLSDGEIKTACQQACPADAIVFGDLNDENSRVYKLFQQERNYHLLEELHTLPSVGYLTKVRNPEV